MKRCEICGEPIKLANTRCRYCYNKKLTKKVSNTPDCPKCNQKTFNAGQFILCTSDNCDFQRKINA